MKRRSEGKGKMLRTRFMAGVAVLCLLTSLLSACSGSGFKKKVIDVPEMARLLVDSMQDDGEIENYYRKIPEDQRIGVTFSEYCEYISILQKMMPRGGRITAFDIVEGVEKQALLSEMLDTDSEEYMNMIESCVPVRVETTGVRASGRPLYFYLQKRDDGEVYLNREWIMSCLNLYAFSVHYFEAYTNQNLTDVESLLPYTEVKEPIPSSEEILVAKAQEMIRFYSVNVTKSNLSDYEMISIDASNLVYLQNDVLDTHLHANTRKVHFKSNSKEEITVLDPITSELKTVDLYLYYNGRRTVKIGEHAAASQLENMFGKPISISCGPVLNGGSAEKNKADGYRNILIRYHGFVITVYGHYYGEDDWEGTYVRFRIWDTEKASIGNEISVDKTSWDVLKRYPFADETDYVLDITMDGDAYVLNVELDREHTNAEGSHPISSLKLSRK